jgi:hypothetical protein
MKRAVYTRSEGRGMRIGHPKGRKKTRSSFVHVCLCLDERGKKVQAHDKDFPFCD